MTGQLVESQDDRLASVQLNDSQRWTVGLRWACFEWWVCRGTPGFQVLHCNGPKMVYKSSTLPDTRTHYVSAESSRMRVLYRLLAYSQTAENKLETHIWFFLYTLFWVNFNMKLTGVVLLTCVVVSRTYFSITLCHAGLHGLPDTGILLWSFISPICRVLIPFIPHRQTSGLSAMCDCFEPFLQLPSRLFD
jgi:hypothetical protein